MELLQSIYGIFKWEETNTMEVIDFMYCSIDRKQCRCLPEANAKHSLRADA